MSDKQIEYFQFHAINEFMVDDFKRLVLKSVFSGFEKLPSEWQKKLNSEVKTKINVSGFRNSALAPVGLKVRAALKPFENDPNFVGVVLQSWLILHNDLAIIVKNLLEGRGWEILSVDADRTELPGFMTRWPEKEDYQIVLDAFHKENPDSSASDDDISLMCVWLSTRLPYLVKEEEE